MSGPTRPPSGGAPRQPWTPDQAPKGVTCPACGLGNEAAARTCRNCGLPIASDSDPLRGVTPGHVDMPSAQRSGLSATIGLALVIGLLLVGGTLAVSGGGILSSGGRLGGDPVVNPSPSPATVVDPDTGEVTPVVDPDVGETTEQASNARGTSFEYTCEDGAIKDLSKGKWFLSEVQAGVRDGFDQIYWTLSRDGKKDVKKATNVTMEWTTPREAQDKYGIPRVQGNRAIVVTFTGPVDIPANQTIEGDTLEAEGIDQIKKIQLFESGGKVRAAIGLRSESCAAMKANGWAKGKEGDATVRLDIERFE